MITNNVPHTLKKSKVIDLSRRWQKHATAHRRHPIWDKTCYSVGSLKTIQLVSRESYIDSSNQRTMAFMSFFRVSFDQASQGRLDQLTQTLALLITTLQQQRKNDMAVIQSVADLITANQSLIALANQLIAKIGIPSPDVADTAAAATSELNAVNAAIEAAQAALNPPQT